MKQSTPWMYKGKLLKEHSSYTVLLTCEVLSY